MQILYFTRTDETATDIEQEGFPEPTYNLRNSNTSEEDQFNLDELDQGMLVKKIIDAAGVFGEVKIFRGNTNKLNDPHIDCNANFYKFENHARTSAEKKDAEGFDVGVTIHGAIGEGDDLLKIGRAVYRETNF